jgi:hypothetical protein
MVWTCSSNQDYRLPRRPLEWSLAEHRERDRPRRKWTRDTTGLAKDRGLSKKDPENR